MATKGTAAHPAVAHRGGLATRLAKLRPEPDLFERMGGRPAVQAWVVELYAGIEGDEELRPLFPRNLNESIRRSQRFFEEWVGGARQWNRYRGLADRHRMPITRRHAERWLVHYEAATAKLPREVQKELVTVARALAYALVNAELGTLPTKEPGLSLACRHTWEPAAKLASQDKRAELEAWIEAHPPFADPGGLGLAVLLVHAARRGRTELVGELIDRGADPNRPDGSTTIFPVSAWAAAMAKGKHETADYLVERGAKIDVFSAAYVGDVERLEALLKADTELANVLDPAIDFGDVTPLVHAIDRGQLGAIELLLRYGADVQHPSWIQRALDSDEPAPILRLLLEGGAPLGVLEPGEWVLDPEIDALLFEHGARFDPEDASWVEFCTGHHGQREHPELIAAFLDRGVGLEARTEHGRTALHAATRMGYLEVMALLLERGADPNAPDGRGDRPLAYLFQARKQVDLVATCQLLLKHGADPNSIDASEQALDDVLARSRKPALRALAEARRALGP